MNHNLTNKLKDFYPIYWINLDGDEERKKYMENVLSRLKLNATRVSGYDGRINDLRVHLTGSFPSNVSQEEVGCVLSHLKVLRKFIEETDYEYAIVLEDDVDFSSVVYWPFDWKFVLSCIPYDWDVLQLVLINTRCFMPKLHTRLADDFSTAAYAITRLYAKKLLKLHIYEQKYKIDNGVKPRPVADELIYNAGKTYSIPLLLYKVELGSRIHEENIDISHKPCRDKAYNFWVNQANNLTPQSFFSIRYSEVQIGQI